MESRLRKFNLGTGLLAVMIVFLMSLGAFVGAAQNSATPDVEGITAIVPSNDFVTETPENGLDIVWRTDDDVLDETTVFDDPELMQLLPSTDPDTDHLEYEEEVEDDSELEPVAVCDIFSGNHINTPSADVDIENEPIGDIELGPETITSVEQNTLSSSLECIVDKIDAPTNDAPAEAGTGTPAGTRGTPLNWFIQPAGSVAKDCQVYIGNPTANQGTYMRLMTNYGRATRGFAEFDFSEIPSGSIIDSATMSFFHHQNLGGGPLELREVLAPWGEMTLTWNNQPAVSATQIDTAPLVVMGEWLDFDVTDILQDWIDGTKSYYGVRISGINGVYNNAYIMSSDCANPYSTFGTCWPKMEVDYHSGSPTHTVRLGPDNPVNSGQAMGNVIRDGTSYTVNTHYQVYMANPSSTVNYRGWTVFDLSDLKKWTGVKVTEAKLVIRNTQRSYTYEVRFGKLSVVPFGGSSSGSTIYNQISTTSNYIGNIDWTTHTDNTRTDYEVELNALGISSINSTIAGSSSNYPIGMYIYRLASSTGARVYWSDIRLEVTFEYATELPATTIAFGDELEGYTDSFGIGATNNDMGYSIAYTSGTTAYRGYAQWDVASIREAFDQGNLSRVNIQSVKVRFNHFRSGVSIPGLSFYHMAYNVTTATPGQIHTDAGDGTKYVTGTASSTYMDHEWNLGATAVTNFQDAFDDINPSFFGVGLTGTSGSNPSMDYGYRLVITFILNPAMPQVILADMTPEGYEGIPLLFDASSSKNVTWGTSNLRFDWDWNNDNTIDQSSTSPYASHTWNDDWTGNMALTVNDTNFNRETKKVFPVVIHNVNPEVNTTAGSITPQPAYEANTLTFSGFTVDDPAGSYDSYMYFFDFDGDRVYDKSGHCSGTTIPTETWYYDDDFLGEVELLVVDEDGGTSNLTVPYKEVCTPTGSNTGYFMSTAGPYPNSLIYYYWMNTYDYRRGYAKIDMSGVPDDAVINKIEYKGYVGYNYSVVNRVGVHLLSIDPTSASPSAFWSQTNDLYLNNRIFNLNAAVGPHTKDLTNYFLNTVPGQENLTKVLDDNWIGFGYDLEDPVTYVARYGYMQGHSYNFPSLTVDYVMYEPGCLIPVVVKNVAPVVNCDNLTVSPSSINEGEKIQVTNLSWYDPGNDDYEAQIEVGGKYKSEWFPLTKRPVIQKPLPIKVLVYYTEVLPGAVDGGLASYLTSDSRFSQVDIMGYVYNPPNPFIYPIPVPSVATMQKYDVVIIWKRVSYGGSGNTGDQLGDNVAAYVESGGGVVVMHPSLDSAGWGVRGKYMAEEYSPIKQTDAMEQVLNTSIGQIDQPNHPILKNVNTTELWTQFYTKSKTLTEDAKSIFWWKSGYLGCAVKYVMKGRTVGLNYQPARVGGADWRLLAANAAVWAGIGENITGYNYGAGYHHSNITIDMVVPDDYPSTGTGWDDVPVTVYIRDDDDGKLIPGTGLAPSVGGTITPTGYYPYTDYIGQKLVADDDYNLYAIYSSSSPYQVYVAKSEDNGVTWISTQVSTPSWLSTTSQAYPSLAIDSSNVLHAVWRGYTSTSQYHVVYANSVDGGATWGNFKNVTTTSSSGYWSEAHPSIAIDGNDKIHLTFRGRDGSTSTYYYGVFYINRTALGTWGTLTRLTSTTSSYYQNYGYEPQLAIDSKNNVHVVWRGRASSVSSSYYNILHRKLTASTGAWSALTGVSTGTTSQQYINTYSISIAIDDNDDAHVVWSGRNTIYTLTYNIFYAKYSSSTDAWGASECITQATSGSPNERYPSIAINDQGDIDVFFHGRTGPAFTSGYVLNHAERSGTTWNINWNIDTGYYVQHLLWGGLDCRAKSGWALAYHTSTNNYIFITSDDFEFGNPEYTDGMSSCNGSVRVYNIEPVIDMNRTFTVPTIIEEQEEFTLYTEFEDPAAGAETETFEYNVTWPGGYSAGAVTDFEPGYAGGDTDLVLKPGPAEGNDSYIYNSSSYLNYNYGINQYVYVGGYKSGTTQYNHRRGLLEWDLSSVPVGTKLANATMTLRFYSRTYSAPEKMYWRPITEGWVEGTKTGSTASPGEVTWNNMPAYNSSINVSSCNWAFTSTTGNGAFVSFPMNVTVVEDWIDHPENNFGIISEMEDYDNSDINWGYFFSSDYSVGATLRPKLELEFVDPLPPRLPRGIMSADITIPDDHPETGTPFDIFNLTIEVSDDDLGNDSADANVTVYNVPPELFEGMVTPEELMDDDPATIIHEGTTVTLEGFTYDDVAFDVWSEREYGFNYSVDWGDGTQTPWKDDFRYPGTFGSGDVGGGGGPANYPFLKTFPTGFTINSPAGATRGNRFTCLSSNIYVTELGVIIPPAYAGSGQRWVTLFDFSTQAQLAQIQITPGTFSGEWAFEKLSSPVALTQGSTYIVAEWGTGYYYRSGITGTPPWGGDSNIQVLGTQYTSGTKDSWPGSYLAGYIYGIADIGYTIGGGGGGGGSSSSGGAPVNWFSQPGSEGKDSQVRSGTTANYGTYTNLMTNYGSAYITRGFVEFDISAIPTGNVIIDDATLSLYHRTNSATGGLELREVTGAWQEMTINWNNQPTVASTQLATFPAGGQPRWLDTDVTDLMQEWIDGTKPNNGVRISGLNGVYNNAYIVSSDYATASQHPKLDVNYHIGGGAGGGVSSMVKEDSSNIATAYNNGRNLVADSNDNIYCVYTDNGTPSQVSISKSEDLGETWTRLFTTSELRPQLEPSIAIDSEDVLHVTWRADMGGYPNIIYANSEDGGITWVNIKEITTGRTIPTENYAPAITVDRNDKAHIVWFGRSVANSAIYNIHYITRTSGGTWSAITMITDETMNLFNQYPAVAVDKQNNVHVVWTGQTQTVPLTNIQYRKCDGSTGIWGTTVMLTSSSTYNNEFPSIVVDRKNDVHLAWHSDIAPHAQIKYLKWQFNTSSWGSEEVLSNTSLSSYSPSITIDYRGYVYVAWYKTEPYQIVMSMLDAWDFTWTGGIQMTGAEFEIEAKVWHPNVMSYDVWREVPARGACFVYTADDETKDNVYFMSTCDFNLTDYPPYKGIPKQTHLYRDDNPTDTEQDNYTIRLMVRDDDTGIGAWEHEFTIHNVWPTIDSDLGGLSLTHDENGQYPLEIEFTDPGTGPTETWDYWLDADNSETWTVGDVKGTVLPSAVTVIDNVSHGTIQVPMPFNDDYQVPTMGLYLYDDDIGTSMRCWNVTVPQYGDGEIYPVTSPRQAYSYGLQMNSQDNLVKDSDGNLYTIYRGYSSYDIMFANSSDMGETWTTSEVTLSDPYDNLYQYYPSLAIDSNGVLHATWCGYTVGYNYYSIRYASSSDGGQTWGNFKIVERGSYIGNTYQYWQFPSIAVDGNDNIHLVYQGYYRNYVLGVYQYTRGIRYVNKIGSTWSTPIWADTPGSISSSYYEYYPSISIDPSNNVHIAYYGTTPLYGTSYPQIMYKKRTAAGVWDSSRTYVTTTSTTAYYQYYPDIATDNSGNVHVTWAGGTRSPLTSYRSIQYRKCTSTGTWGSIEIVHQAGAPTYYLYYPSIGTDQAGTIYLAYRSYSSPYEVYLKTKTTSSASWSSLLKPTTGHSTSINYMSVLGQGLNQWPETGTAMVFCSSDYAIYYWSSEDFDSDKKVELLGYKVQISVTIENVDPYIDGGVTALSGAPNVVPVEFNALITDQGSDDLRFNYTWGDGSALVTSPWFYNDGTGPDPYPSPFTGTAPFVVDQTLTHTYNASGEYWLNITIWDDDNGTSFVSIPVSIFGAKGLKEQAAQLLIAFMPGQTNVVGYDRITLKFLHEKGCTLAEEMDLDILIYNERDRPPERLKHTLIASLTDVDCGDTVTLDTTGLTAGIFGKHLKIQVYDSGSSKKLEEIKVKTRYDKKHPLTVGDWFEDKKDKGFGVEIVSFDEKLGTTYDHYSKLGKKVEHGIEHILASLNQNPRTGFGWWHARWVYFCGQWTVRTLWIDNMHLDPEYGKKVFDEEKKAVKDLEKVVKDILKSKGIHNMTFKWLGNEDVDIEVYEHGKWWAFWYKWKLTDSFKNVQTDDEIFIGYDGTPLEAKLGKKIEIRIYKNQTGELLEIIKIHTSGSKPLQVAPGCIYGGLEIVSTALILDKKSCKDGPIFDEWDTRGKKEDKEAEEKRICENLTNIIASIKLLVQADKLLAMQAMTEAENMGVNSTYNKFDKYTKELDKARKHMDKAELKAQYGDHHKAIGEYKKAWQHSIKAMKEIIKHNAAFNISPTCGKIPWWYYWYQ